MKLVLGTAQFGMDYGVSNQAGRTSKEEIGRILEYASEQGVSLIDTAAAYGDAESLLGEFVSKTPGFEFITKITGKLNVNTIDQMVSHSLKNLSVDSLYALLLHSAADLLDENGEAIYSKLKVLQENGLVKKIGVSVYTREEIDAVIKKYDIDIIQMPVNVYDQRLLQGDYLKSLKSRGIELHIRSVFLQGLLLMDPGQMLSHFDPIKPNFIEYRNQISSLGLTPLQAAIGFVNSIPEADALIVGVNNFSQLKEICQCKDTIVDINSFGSFGLNDPTYLDPSQWNLG